MANNDYSPYTPTATYDPAECCTCPIVKFSDTQAFRWRQPSCPIHGEFVRRAGRLPGMPRGYQILEVSSSVR